MGRGALPAWAAAAILLAGWGCGGSASLVTTSAARPSSSEVAVSVVSGSLNLSAGSALGRLAPARRRTLLERVRDALAPVGSAYADSWTCTGGVLSPAFSGSSGDPYAYTPRTCSVTWGDEEVGSSAWSGPFTLSYGASCDDSHADVLAQAAGCTLRRTTGPGGATRTITGPHGTTYAVTHDTNGAGSGWDATVTPAPTDGGVVIACGAGGCATGNGTVAINGSHLYGTVALRGGSGTRIWDHTVSTPAGPLTCTDSGAGRSVSGAVTVQHNLAHYTAVATFDAVKYGDPTCCFPTAGTVTTSYQGGPLRGQTETLAFSSVCGEATITIGGRSAPLTLVECL